MISARLAASSHAACGSANSRARPSTFPSFPQHDRPSMHDFEPLVGSWRVHHKRLKERLNGCTEWEEFEGTCTLRSLMDGQANVDDNVLHLPSGTYRAASFRTFD